MTDREQAAEFEEESGGEVPWQDYPNKGANIVPVEDVPGPMRRSRTEGKCPRVMLGEPWDRILYKAGRR